MWIILAVFISVTLLALAGAAYQQMETAREAELYPAPGKLYDVGGHRLHICLTEGPPAAAGKPTVILDSGLGATSMSWRLVQGKVGETDRVVSYDRAGLGWSDPSPLPRTSEQNVAELRALLRQAKIPPPYILVGHSFGAYNCRLFAGRYPEEVAGMVLVDGIHPREWLEPDALEERHRIFGVRLCRRGARYARLGVARAYLEGVIAGQLGLTQPAFHFLSSGATIVGQRVVNTLRKLPPELQRIVLSHWSRPSFFSSTGSHMEHIRTSAAQVAEVELPPNIPLTILSPADARPGRLEAAEELARTCSQARHVIVEDAGHFLQLDRPDAVVAAISGMIERSS